MSGYQLLSPDGLKQRLRVSDTVRFIDVRSYDEFAAVHVEGAVCAPLPGLLEHASKWSVNDDVILICQSGQRAREAADALRQVGFERLTVVDGGTRACEREGLSLMRGRKRLPIQRQVFMGAGFVVLLGLALSMVNPAFVLISWFAGLSLIAAGISGFCPMAAMLAVAPWNRSREHSGAAGRAQCTVKGGCP